MELERLVTQVMVEIQADLMHQAVQAVRAIQAVLRAVRAVQAVHLLRVFRADQVLAQQAALQKWG